MALTKLDTPDSGVRVLQLNDVEHKNVFRPALVDEILEQLAVAANQPDTRVLILRGLPDVFAAGADKESLLSLADGTWSVKDLLISEKLLEFPLPVIAAMEGHGVGGGLVMGLCCDMVLMAEESRYGANFMGMGFTPGMGCTRLLAGLVGPYVAAELMYTATRYKGRHFRGLAAVNYVLPKAEVFPKALDVARAIADKPRSALELLKYSMTLAKRQLLAEARVHEDMMHKLTFSAPGMRKRIEDSYAGS